MPVTAFSVLRTLHILSAALALGALVAVTFMQPGRRIPPVLHKALLERIGRIERLAIWPGTVGVLLAGLLLVEGPVARFSFTAPDAGWLHIGSTLWLFLAATVFWMTSSRRKLEALAEEGSSGISRADRLWNRWLAAAILAILLLGGGIATMTMKLAA